MVENSTDDPELKRSQDSLEHLRHLTETTIAHYDRYASQYWHGTRDHDASQNTAALLDAIEAEPPYTLVHSINLIGLKELTFFRDY